MELTNLDKELIKIATENPDRFVRLVGIDKWNRMKVCILRENGSSYGQIENRLSSANLTIKEIRGACLKCD